MNLKLGACPTWETLMELGTGCLSLELLTQLAEHLEHCESCEVCLSTIEADYWGLRDLPILHSDFQSEPAYAELIQRLENQIYFDE